MAQQTIGVGTVADDGTGDPVRTAFQKVNANFTEVYAVTADADIVALAGLAATAGMLSRTGAGAFIARTITGTSPVQVSNGTGAGGNPTISVDAATTSASGIVELATTAETITGTDTVRALTPAGLAGFFANGQIPFPASQNASADPNTFDDYEEGTWTPGIAFGGGSTGVTYTSQLGKYTKLGNVFALGGQLTLSNKGSSTGAPTITGSPFTFSGTLNVGMQITPVGAVFASLTAGLSGDFAAAGTTINIRGPSSTGAAALTEANFTNTSQMRFGGVAFV